MKTAKINVDYLDHMGDDLTVVNAARVSFDKTSNWEYVGEVDVWHVLSDKDTKLISYLAKHNHWSPFAHCSASFRVKAPIFVARQLVKHTVGFSWNEVSRRYVDNEPEFYIPDEWRLKADNVKQGSSEQVHQHSIAVRDGVANLSQKALDEYNWLLKENICPEMARMVLPQNTMTEWVWTGTLYAWARMCALRLDSHTQKETQVVARKIDAIMLDLFPISWEALKENK